MAAHEYPEAVKNGGGNGGVVSPWQRTSVGGVSDSVARALEAAGVVADDCRVCVRSPLLRSGRFGAAWLALSPDRLAIVEDDGSRVTDVVSLPLERLRGAKVESFSGGGALFVNVEGAQQEVLRYDGGNAAVFGTVAKRLNDATAPPAEDDEKKENSSDWSPRGSQGTSRWMRSYAFLADFESSAPDS